jgi:hypothetical protein
MADEEKEDASEGSSVRDSIMGAIKELEGEDSPEVAAPGRDESGRFAPKEQPNDSHAVSETDPASPEPARVARESAPAAPEGAPAPAGSAPELAAAPQSWDNASKAKWAALDPELKAFINKREADIHKGLTKMDGERQFAKDMQQVTAPYEALIRSAGVSVPQAVQQVLNTAYILRTADPMTKAREIATVCQQYGVDLNLLAQPQGQQQSPEVQQLQQRLAQMESQFTQRQQAERQQLETQVLNAVETFGQDPKHPHFKAVSAHMGALMQAGEAKDMEEAYEMAVWARPDIRSQLQSQQSQVQQARVKTEKARAKAVSVRGGPGGYTAPAQNPNMSVRESLEAAMQEVQGRL